MQLNHPFFLSVLLLFCCFSLVYGQQPKAAKKKARVSAYEPSPMEVLPAQLAGAWETSYVDDSGRQVQLVAIVTEGFWSETAFNEAERAFYWTAGGSWTTRGDEFTGTYEFHTAEPDRVGKDHTEQFSLRDNGTLTFSGSTLKWKRLDMGAPGKLFGAWLITGRERNGEMSRRNPGPRKTMKILSGRRFQWIAYNTETGQFFGTGGGTYTTEDGKYTEHIEFFSRNSERVGASLEFDYALKNGEWHHRGLSSSGKPIYEIWSPRD